MKKLKALLFTLLVSVVSISGIYGVNAKTYNTYHNGDKIKVKVNDTTQLEFYVVEDHNDVVEALYVTSSATNLEYYTYSEVLSEIATYQKLWSNVTKVELPDIRKVLNWKELPTDAGEFDEPSFAKADSYWTVNQNERGHWCISKNLFKKGTYGVFEDNAQSVGIRPYITVLKDYVEGGVIDSTENEEKPTPPKADEVWEQFIVEFKKLQGDNGTSVETTDHSLKVTSQLVNGQFVTTNLTYQNGILSFTSDTDEIAIMISNNDVIADCLDAFINLKGYNAEEVDAWGQKNAATATLENDGLELKTKLIPGFESIQLTAITSFKIDLVNGLKNLKGSVNPNPEEVKKCEISDGKYYDKTGNLVDKTTYEKSCNVVENPSTGIYYGFAALLIALCGGVFAYFHATKKNKFPQV